MVKQFLKQLSPIEILFLFIVPLIGAFLRLASLDVNGFWIDELATIYFAEHLDLVFLHETHTPLFYLLVKPFISLFGFDVSSLKAVTAVTSLSLLSLATLLSSKIFSPRGVVIFVVLLFLSPMDIVAARMFRQYALFFELSLILLLLTKIPDSKNIYKFLISVLITGLHPFGLLVPASLFLEGLISKRKDFIYLLSIVPVAIYYASKWAVSNGKSFFAGYPMSGGEKAFNLIEDTLLVFLGEHYPRINSYPLPYSYMVIYGFFLASFLGFSFWKYYKKKESNPFFVQGILLLLVSILAVQFFSYFVLNLKLGRYLVFLMAPIILNMTYVLSRYSWTSVTVFFLHLPLILAINPFIPFNGEREAFSDYLKAKERNPNLALVVCANKYQFHFYLNSPEIPCQLSLNEAKFQNKEIHFIDMNGYGRDLLLEIGKTYNIENVRMYNSITISAKGAFRTK